MLHPDARALLDLIDKRGLPAMHTLTPVAARAFYRDRRAFTQPDAPEVGDAPSGGILDFVIPFAVNSSISSPAVSGV